MAKLYREKYAQRLPIRSQANRINDEYSNWQVIVRKGLLTGIGKIRPSVNSSIYTVKLTHRHNYRRPRVVMIDPVMQKRNGEYPHHKLEQNRLCLYYPKFKEWLPHMFISDTIIPWISLWLCYYEHWLKHGDWLGGGTKYKNGKVVEIDEPLLQ